jgi:uncharacterized protein (DUF1800 family)
MAPRFRIIAGLLVAAAAALGPAVAAAAGAPLRFYTVRPCRAVDTRGSVGPNGGPALVAGAARTFVLAGQCGISPTASAVSVNLTVTGSTAAGFVALYPDGSAFPGVSTINFRTGQTRANSGVASLGPAGGVTALLGQAAGTTTNLILDVNGYFDDPANNQPPIVTAGPNQSIIFPATAPLTATASDDGKPTATLTYQWSKVSGPGTVSFNTPAALTATATFSVAGAYVVRFTASDSLLSSSADVSVNVDVSNDSLRFINQATWGPTDALIQELKTKPLSQWIDEQITMPSSGWPDMTLQPTTPPTGCGGGTACNRDNYTMYPLQTRFFTKALYAPDQLRQRMVWALHKILVISGRDITQPSWMTPYIQILDRNAFGTYRQLLSEITLNPGMGRYLDAVTSTKTRPNENFAREVNQLFSIGTVLLNPDGTAQLDGFGNPLPTYDQGVVDGFTKIFTGWSYAAPPSPGVLNYKDPMVVVASNHDTTDKQLYYPQIVPGGQTPQQDLDSALNAIISHPNTGPFVSRELIKEFVTSNPSPAYVARVAAVFDNDGLGNKGNLGPVIKAILLDPEARGGATGRSADGTLVEPVLLATRLLRGLNAKSFNLTGQSDGVINQEITLMGQDVWRPETVFSYFPADYVLPGTDDYAAPEFGLMGAQSALRRANFVYKMLYTGIAISGNVTLFIPAGTALDLSTFGSYAPDANALVERINQQMMCRTMSAAMKAQIVNAVNAIPATDLAGRVRQAVYLMATSAQYQTQR